MHTGSEYDGEFASQKTISRSSASERFVRASVTPPLVGRHLRLSSSVFQRVSPFCSDFRSRFLRFPLSTMRAPTPKKSVWGTAMSI